MDTKQRIRIQLSPDRLLATVEVRPGAAAGEAQLRQALHKAGVQAGILAEVLSEQSIRLADPDYTCPATPIAQGSAPREGTPGTLEMVESMQPEPVGHSRGDGSLDYREHGGLVNVSAGDIIATHHPPQPGTEGRGVDGRVTPAPKPDPGLPRLGAGVSLDPAGNIVSQIDGMLHHLPGALLDVSECSEHEGDVDLRSGNLHAKGSLVVRGSIQNGALVEATAHIVVQGGIDNGCARAGADLEVHGGIKGQDAGPSSAAGRLSCAHLSAARVEAGGPVEVRDHCLNSTVQAESFAATHGRGKVCGGRVRVVRRLHLLEAGSAHGTPTLLVAAWPQDELVAVQRARLAYERARRRRNKRSDQIGRAHV